MKIRSIRIKVNDAKDSKTVLRRITLFEATHRTRRVPTPEQPSNPGGDSTDDEHQSAHDGPLPLRLSPTTTLLSLVGNDYGEFPLQHGSCR